MLTPRTKPALVLAGLVLCLLALLNTQLELERSWRGHHEVGMEDVAFPDHQWMRLLCLNYNTVGADLIWLTLVTRHALFVSVHGGASGNLLESGFVAARTDPGFYRLYDWVPGAYLNRRYPITAADLDRIADFYDIGIARFPEDAALRLSAALSFIGYGSGFSNATYVRQSARAVSYLERAVELAPEDEEIVGVLAYFRKRQQKYAGGASKDDQAAEVAFWLDVLRTTTDDQLRQRAVRQLKELGGQTPAVAAQRELIAEQQSSQPYLPFPLWAVMRNKE